MKTIPLTKGFFTKVDDEDYERLAVHRWQAHPRCGYPNKIGVTRGLKKDHKSLTITMAREIVNAPNGKYVDHINGDTLDNRKCNLRICSNAENVRNRGSNKNNTSGYKGVNLEKKNGRWTTRIQVNQKMIHIGCFATKEDAAVAYDKAAIKYFGEFARLNFPNTNYSFRFEK